MKKEIVSIFVFVVLIAGFYSSMVISNIVSSEEINDNSIISFDSSVNNDVLSRRKIEVKKSAVPEKLFNLYWAKGYDGDDQDESVEDLDRTSDGYIVLGNVWYTSAPSEIFIMKVDKTGNTSSMTKYNFGDYQIIARSLSAIEITPDQYEYVIAGYLLMEAEFFVMKIDDNGNPIWAYSYDNLLTDKANSIKTYMNDGEFCFVCAGLSSTASGEQNNRGTIFTLDSDGNIINDAYYIHDDGVVFNDVACFPSTENPDEFIVAGYSRWSDDTSRAFLMSVDSDDLSVNWAKEYDSLDSNLESWIDEIKCIKITSDEKIVLVGRGTSNEGYYYNNMLIIKTNSVGNIEWANNYEYSSHSTIAYSVDEIPGEGYFVTGDTYTIDISYSNELFTTLIDESNGNIISTRVLQKGKPNYDCNNIIRPTWGTSVLWDSNVCIVARRTGSSFYEQFLPDNIVIMKCSKRGMIRLGCCSEEFEFQLSDLIEDYTVNIDVVYPFMTKTDIEVNLELIDVESEYICKDYTLTAIIAWPYPGSLSIFDILKIKFPLIKPKALILGPVTVEVDAHTDEGTQGINRVEFIVDDEVMFVDDDSPYTWKWKERSTGKRLLKIVVYDELGFIEMRNLDVIKYL